MTAGQSIDCTGTLMGAKAGTTHEDKATVVGESVFTGTDGKHQQVTDNDNWNGKMPAHPAIDVEKYNTSDGATKGDRDNASDSLLMKSDSEGITFAVTNTGDVTLTNVTLSDKTVAGTGNVSGITCLVGGKHVAANQIGTMTAGQKILCTGTLKGVAAGTKHTDTATVTGLTPTKQTVKDTDDWNGSRNPALIPPKPVTPKGAQTGDPVMAQHSHNETVAAEALGGLAALGLVGTGFLARRRKTTK